MSRSPHATELRASPARRRYCRATGGGKASGPSPLVSVASPPCASQPLRLAAGTSSRLWEVDTLRGLAVLAMIVFHFAWDWAYVNGTRLGDDSQYASGIIAGTFITLLGLSIALDRDRVRAAGGSQWRRTSHRFLLIGGAAALVTLATRLALPDEFVYFGILHLLAVCTVLVASTARLGAVANALIGLALLVVGWSAWLDGPGPGALWAVAGWWAPRATVDWYPLAPWAGFAFLGFAAGRYLYASGHRRLPLRDMSAPTAPLRFLGRHALLVYLVHQLVLFPLAWLLARLMS